jgi:chromate transporter
MLAGIAAGAAGLMLSMAAKMARPLVNRQMLVPLAFVALSFLGVGPAKLSLILVLAVLVPLSIAYAWWKLP